MLISPPSRNSADRILPEFEDGKWPHHTDGCNCAANAGGCPAAAARAAGNGQPCLWFSNGCTIGCPDCNGIHGHTNVSLCPNPTARPMLNDSRLRTMNVNTKVGSGDDVYMWNPWRAPWTAPVKDACGMAGGSWNVTPGDATVFATTKFARQGDHGSTVLKPGPAGATWVAGSVVEVAWAIRYNHGGGCGGTPSNSGRVKRYSVSRPI